MTNVRVYHNVGRTPDREYLPMSDGYRDGSPLVLVAEYDEPRQSPLHSDLSRIAEDAYRIFNVGDDPDFGTPDPRAVSYRQRGNRSLSTGDVVGIGEAFLAVADLGFEPVDVRPSQVVERTEHGTTPFHPGD